MERLRRRGAEAKALDPSHAMDTSKPWKWVWSVAHTDMQFWKDQLEDPAMLVLTRTKSQGAVLDGDAQVAGAAPPPKRPKTGDLHHNYPPPQLSVEGGKGGKGGKGNTKTHIANGVHTRNRSDKELCQGFDEGTCTQTQGENLCSHTTSRVHQCHFCLQASHGGHACSVGVAQNLAAKQIKRRAQKGRGKGGK